jgi:threonine synthase
MIACEPAARAPLTQALATNMPAVQVAPGPTAASGIAVRVNGYRGVVAVRESGGEARRLPDPDIEAAQAALARTGLWGEMSAAAGLAGIRQAVLSGEQFDGPVVAIATSSGFKDDSVGQQAIPVVAPEWDAVAATLASRYGIDV